MRSILLSSFAITLALSVPAVAQKASDAASNQPANQQRLGTVQDIQISGANDLLTDFLKATLQVQAGTPLSEVNLRQVEQEVLSAGFFKSVEAKFKVVDGKDVLDLQVIPHPTIIKVEAEGMNFLSAEDFKRSIAELLNIAPDATLNTERIEQAKQALADNYTQESYPFTPSISSRIDAEEGGGVVVKFIVDESAPLRRIEIEGVSLLKNSTVANLFKPMYDAKLFTSKAFFAAARQLQSEYEKQGYIQAGINPRGISLKDGVLKIKVIEGIVGGISLEPLRTTEDLSGLLKTKVEEPLSLKKLQADVRTLANKTGKPVGFALRPDPQATDRLIVFFGASETETGPIEKIEIVGNTAISDETLRKAVISKLGDVYTPQTSQEDFFALREAYRKAGYDISTRDAIEFKGGVLKFNIREVKVVKYEVNWKGKKITDNRVISREFPKAGGLFNLNEVREVLQNISRLGFVKILGENIKVNPENPEEVTYALQVSEINTGFPVSLSLSYDSLAGGWSGNVGYTNSNVFGLSHNIGFEVSAQQNDAGQNWVGNVTYTIPWLDYDFLDFREKRTSLSTSLYSVVSGNIAINNERGESTNYEYSTRRSGLGFSVGRNISPELRASLGMSLSNRNNFMEPVPKDKTAAVVKDANGNVVKDANGNDMTYSEAQAKALMPQGGWTTRFDGSLNWDNTDNGAFPGRGFRANSNLGYNFGNEGDKGLSWFDAEFGVRGYYGFGEKTQRTYGIETYKNVVAARANYGTLLGIAPQNTLYYVGGSNMISARELRGVSDYQLKGTSYLSGSVEYRRDFGLSAGVAQGVFGVLFADYGQTWNSNTGTNNGALGLGVGLQVNLGLGNSRLPSLRFDYGISPKPEGGVNGRFGFRLGDFW